MKIMYRLSYKMRHIQQIEVKFQGVECTRPIIRYRYTNPLDYKKYQLKRFPDGWLRDFTDDKILFFETLDEAKKVYIDQLDRDIFLKSHELSKLNELKSEIEELSF